MQAMLAKVSSPDDNLEQTLKVLYESSLLRSGYSLKDPVEFAKNIEKVVRTNLNVDLEVQAKVDVKPAPDIAPPVDLEEDEEEGGAKPKVSVQLQDGSSFEPEISVSSSSDEEHDEL
jgi:heat shock protein beta